MWPWIKEFRNGRWINLLQKEGPTITLNTHICREQVQLLQTSDSVQNVFPDPVSNCREGSEPLKDPDYYPIWSPLWQWARHKLYSIMLLYVSWHEEPIHNHPYLGNTVGYHTRPVWGGAELVEELLLSKPVAKGYGVWVIIILFKDTRKTPHHWDSFLTRVVVLNEVGISKTNSTYHYSYIYEVNNVH